MNLRELSLHSNGLTGNQFMLFQCVIFAVLFDTELPFTVTIVFVNSFTYFVLYFYASQCHVVLNFEIKMTSSITYIIVRTVRTP